MALLPDTSIEDSAAIIENTTEPNKTYKMKIDEERIEGQITEAIEAVKQAAYKILNTERYKHIIYSWNYGVELADLFGKPIPYVLPEIPRRIKEALIQDDRIDNVSGFDLEYDKRGNVLAKFTIESIYGDIDFSLDIDVA